MEAPKHEKATLPNFLRERECIFHVPYLRVVKIEIDFVSKKSCCRQDMSRVEVLTKALYRRPFNSRQRELSAHFCDDNFVMTI